MTFDIDRMLSSGPPGSLPSFQKLDLVPRPRMFELGSDPTRREGLPGLDDLSDRLGLTKRQRWNKADQDVRARWMYSALLGGAAGEAETGVGRMKE
jgi:hypothetical protein